MSEVEPKGGEAYLGKRTVKYCSLRGTRVVFIILLGKMILNLWLWNISYYYWLAHLYALSYSHLEYRDIPCPSQTTIIYSSLVPNIHVLFLVTPTLGKVKKIVENSKSAIGNFPQKKDEGEYWKVSFQGHSWLWSWSEGEWRLGYVILFKSQNFSFCM